HQLVRSYDDIHPSILKVGQGFPAFFCGPEPVEIIYSYRKILQPFGKCFMMLKCKYSGWYQNSDLLSIIYSFKAARIATSVFPKPTSPHTRRSIGFSFSISSLTAAVAVVWSGVSS